MRGLLLFFSLLSVCCAGSLEDAVRTLSRKLAARLSPGESVTVSGKNFSTLAGQEVERARSLMARALRRTPARGKEPFQLLLTVSENPQGHLLIAELRRGLERIVEMAPFTVPPQAAPARPVLSRRLLWEQQTVLLDVLQFDNRMLVLDMSSLSLFAQRAGKWELESSQPLDIAPQRDPRGRMEASGDALHVLLPGMSCEGAWMPALRLTCNPAEDSFLAGRNTLAGGVYANAPIEVSGVTLQLSAAEDGRIHLNDEKQNTLATFDAMGSGVASPGELCGSKAFAFLTGPGDSEGGDTVTLYDWTTRKPVEAGNRLEFIAAIRELWPRPGGALAITANPTNRIYSAYLVTVDCSR